MIRAYPRSICSSIRDRLATYEEDRKAARPAAEVRERLLRRHPAP